MAKSRFEYVRHFELPDNLLPNTYIVVRIDGRNFHKYAAFSLSSFSGCISSSAPHHRFSDSHAFEKPNDTRALRLMDRAARSVMDELSDVVLSFGESDEYRYASRYGRN